jgi:hypothetical protein
MPSLHIPKLDFYSFQFVITITKQTERQGLKVHTTVYRDFDFVEALLTFLNFYYLDPHRLIYFTLKCFMRPGEVFVFKDAHYSDIEFKLTVYPIRNAKMPTNKEDFLMLTNSLEEMLQEFLTFSLQFSFTKNMGDAISTLGGHN